MKFHPYSEIFPLLDGEALAELTEDIRKHGLREPIVMYRGAVLDGRNRFLACQKANIKPSSTVYTGTDEGALAWVVSANIHRRHLNESQRAMAGVEIARILGKSEIPGQICPENGEGKRHANDEAAAKAVNVSARSIRTARKVVEKGSSELKKAVKNGKVRASKAAKAVDLPKPAQLAAATAKAPAPPAKVPESPLEAALPPGIDLTDYEPDDDEAYKASIENVMMADDKLGAMRKELEEAYRQLHVMTESRNYFQTKAGEHARTIEDRNREISRLKKKLEKLQGEAKAA